MFALGKKDAVTICTRHAWHAINVTPAVIITEGVKTIIVIIKITK